jgi:hypothetical protein
MDARGYRQCTPRNDDPFVARLPLVDFSSGLFQRALDRLPKQGSKSPWRWRQNYALDFLALKFGALGDGALRFSNASAPKGSVPAGQGAPAAPHSPSAAR